MTALTRAQVKNLDRIAMERFGIPGVVLMENAGRGATESLLTRYPAGGPFAIIAGRGNNGGDGFVIARRLTLLGARVRLILLGPPEGYRGAGEAGLNYSIAEKMGIEVRVLRDPAQDLRGLLSDIHVVVDAILGTGLSGEVRGLPRDCIDAVNLSRLPVFAVDIPSGLDCDAGTPLGAAIRASATATFAAMKVGFLLPGAADYTGPVDVVDIGSPLVWE